MKVKRLRADFLHSLGLFFVLRCACKLSLNTWAGIFLSVFYAHLFCLRTTTRAATKGVENRRETDHNSKSSEEMAEWKIFLGLHRCLNPRANARAARKPLSKTPKQCIMVLPWVL